MDKDTLVRIRSMDEKLWGAINSFTGDKTFNSV